MSFRIVGTDAEGWVCSKCHQKHALVAFDRQVPGGTYLCEGCLRSALELFESETAAPEAGAGELAQPRAANLYELYGRLHELVHSKGARNAEAQESIRKLAARAEELERARAADLLAQSRGFWSDTDSTLEALDAKLEAIIVKRKGAETEASVQKLMAAVQVLAIDYHLNDTRYGRDKGNGVREVLGVTVANPTTTAQCSLCEKEATAETRDEARNAIEHVAECVAAPAAPPVAPRPRVQAKPIQLEDGSWGASVPVTVNLGDKLMMLNPTGNWKAYVTHRTENPFIVRVMKDTSREPA